MSGFITGLIGTGDFDYKVSQTYNNNQNVINDLVGSTFSGLSNTINYLQMALMNKTCSDLKITHRAQQFGAYEIENYKDQTGIDPEHWRYNWNVRDADKLNYHALVFITIRKGVSILNKLDADYEDQKNISLMLQEDIHHKVRVYKSADGRGYTICSNKITHLMTRKMMGLIPKIWTDREYNNLDDPLYTEALGLFVKDNPTEEEYDQWNTLAAALLDKLPLIQTYKTKLLNEFINSRMRDKISQAKRNYDEANNTIRDYTQSIANSVKKLEQYSAQIESFSNAANLDCTDLAQYLSTNKSIVAYELSDGKIYLAIAASIDYFDPQIMASYLKHDTSFVSNIDRSCPGIKQLCKDLFIDCKYTLTCKSVAKMDIISMNINNGDFGTFNLNLPYIDQPHIMQYNCWGNNGPIIIQAIKNNDYVGAIAQITSACKNLNMGDSTVMNRLLNNIASNKNRKWITDETGTLRSFNELYNAPVVKTVPTAPTVDFLEDIATPVRATTVGDIPRAHAPIATADPWDEPDVPQNDEDGDDD